MNTSQLRPVLPALLLVLLPQPAIGSPTINSFEQRCQAEMRPNLEVIARHSGFVVHNTVSARVLNTRGPYASAGQAMMGMTASSTRAEVYLEGTALSDLSNGRECIAPRVTVELTYQPLDVYVARELHPASCSYREVYAHEMQHVKIYADNLPQIEQRVREELVRRHGGQPLFAPKDKGLAILNEQIDSWLRPLLKAELAKVELQQVALDSRDETERLSHLCQGELANLMGSSF